MQRNAGNGKHIHGRLYRVLAVVTYILNFVDLDYTLYALPNIPGSYEANPVVFSLLKTPVLAVVFKLLVIPLLLYAMYHCRDRLIARFGIWLCFFVYAVNFSMQVMVFISYLQL